MPIHTHYKNNVLNNIKYESRGIMKKEILEIDKDIYESGKYTFIIYLIPDRNNLVRIFVERDDCEFVSFAKVINADQIKHKKDEYVKENIADWIIGWEFDINQ